MSKAKHTKPFFKINFEDLEIAQNFFENEKHFSEFLLAVSYYYRGVDYTIKQKIVQRYFNTYKKTMDFIIESKKTGSEGGKQRVENQKIKENTLEGVLEPPLEPNNKELSINNKEEKINNKLIKQSINKSTILKGFLGLKNGVNRSINEYLGGDG